MAQQEFDYDYEDNWPNVDGEKPEEIIPNKAGKKPYLDKARDKERIRKTYGTGIQLDGSGFPIGKDGLPEHRPSRIPKPPKKPNMGQRLVQHLKDKWNGEIDD